MDTKFTIIFFLVTLILEILPIRRYLEKVNTYRSTDYSDIDDTVMAERIRSGSSYDDEHHQHEYWARYEYCYKGKRHRVTLTGSNDDFPLKMELTVNRKNGRHKTPEGERRVRKAGIGLIIGAAVCGYIIASLICGYSPLFS